MKANCNLLTFTTPRSNRLMDTQSCHLVQHILFGVLEATNSWWYKDGSDRSIGVYVLWTSTTKAAGSITVTALCNMHLSLLWLSFYREHTDNMEKMLWMVTTSIIQWRNSQQNYTLARKRFLVPHFIWKLPKFYHRTKKLYIRTGTCTFLATHKPVCKQSQAIRTRTGDFRWPGVYLRCRQA